MGTFIGITCVAGLVLCLTFLAQLSDERLPEWTMWVLLVVSSPVWLPIAFVLHVIAVLAKECEWDGSRKRDWWDE